MGAVDNNVFGLVAAMVAAEGASTGVNICGESETSEVTWTASGSHDSIVAEYHSAEVRGIKDLDTVEAIVSSGGRDMKVALP